MTVKTAVPPAGGAAERAPLREARTVDEIRGGGKALRGAGYRAGAGASARGEDA